MLSVNNVTKKYGKVIANENISLQIADGQIAVLLGPNGAGKSTIIKSIIGFLKYQGSVTVDGLLNKSIEAKRIMGYIPEIPSLYPNLTVDEHMEFVARAYKLDNYKEYKEELLRRFELDDKKKKFNEIMSMNVTPSTGTNLLDVTINTDLNMIDASGNIVEDTDSITAEQYYADKGIDINSENFNSADNGSGSTDDSSDDGSDDDSGSYDDSSYDDGSYDDSYDESEE